MSYFNGLQSLETPEYLTNDSTNSAGPSLTTTTPWAGPCHEHPYQWTKQVASHWGGTRNGTIVSLAEGYPGQG